MPSTRAVGLAAVAFLAGVAVGGVAAVALTPADGGTVDPANPRYSISTGTGCIEQADDWAFTAPVGSSDDADRVFLVNASVAHAPDRDLDARLEYAGEGRYLFVLTTSAADAKSGTPDCSEGTYGSTVELAATLPGDFESVTVVYDGTRVGVVENSDDRSPVYRPLSF